MKPVCFLQGNIIPLEEAKVGILDLALLRGFGIYEGLAAHRGEPFRFTDHWKRLQSSAQALSLSIPFSETEVLEAMRHIIRQNAGDGRAIVRMILTGGRADGGIKHVSGREVLYIVAEPMTPYPPEWYTLGAHTIIHEHKRLLPEYKTIDYTAAVLLQPLLAKNAAAEAIYVSKGEVLECTGSNVFIVRDGVISTPKDSILLGITRKVTIELASESGHSVQERAISLPELLSADEVFITSSFKDVVPVTSVDAHSISNGAPGKVTQELMARFAELVAV